MWWCRQRTLEGQSSWERSLIGTLGSSPAWVCGEGWTSHKVCQGWKPLWSDHPGTRPQQHHGSPILSTSSIFSNLIETKTRPLSPNANQVVAWAVTWLIQQAWGLKPCTFQRNHWSLTSSWVNLWALGISCLVRVSLYTRDLGPGHIMYAATRFMANTCFCMYTWGFGSYCIILTSGGAGDWVVKVSHVGAPRLPDWPPIKTWDAKSRVSFRGWQYFTSAVPHCCWES